ncbi:hypothetical protein PV08_03271 [Exophiala spinifera]|uniref:Uncharacterized protein n=1 Tax=Exophiala spinifera TaxID=91928 RepID=A0A0D2A223_9EURO|nr:uncharacterized protein PV08_03271 [Exophiala spinifera]KIW18982.1 hypothetical protein PV08_03271 [Exophiala spinifera]
MEAATGRHDEVEVEWARLLANLESYNRQTASQTVSKSLEPPERTQSIQSAREDPQTHQQCARIDLIDNAKAQEPATDSHKAKYVERHTRPDGSLLPSAFANDFTPRPTRQRRARKTGHTGVSPWARQAMETRWLLSLHQSREKDNGPPTPIHQPRPYPGGVTNAVVRERLGVVGAHWTSPAQDLSDAVAPMRASRQSGLAGDASPATGMSHGGTSDLAGSRPSDSRDGTMANAGAEQEEVYFAVDRPFTLYTIAGEKRTVNELVWRLFDIPIFGWTPRYPFMSAAPQPGQFQQDPGEVYVSRDVSYYGSDRETANETDLNASRVVANSPDNEAHMSRLRLTRSEPLHDWPRRSAIDDYYEEDSDDDEPTRPGHHRRRHR